MGSIIVIFIRWHQDRILFLPYIHVFAAIITNTNQLLIKLLLFVVFPLHIKPEQSGLWCFVSTVITVYTAIAVSIITCSDHEHQPKPWGAQIHYGRPVQIESVFICDWSLVWKIIYTLFLLQRLGLPTCSVALVALLGRSNYSSICILFIACSIMVSRLYSTFCFE